MSRFATVPEAAKKMSVHPNTVRAMIARGDLPAMKLVRQYRIRVEDIDALIAPAAPLAPLRA